MRAGLYWLTVIYSARLIWISVWSNRAVFYPLYHYAGRHFELSRHKDTESELGNALNARHGKRASMQTQHSCLTRSILIVQDWIETSVLSLHAGLGKRGYHQWLLLPISNCGLLTAHLFHRVSSDYHDLWFLSSMIFVNPIIHARCL